MAVQAPTTFSGTTGAVGTSGLQTAEAYLLGTSNVGTASATTDLGPNSPASGRFAADPSIMASAWDLPPNLGSLRLQTGTSAATPVNAKTATNVSSGIEMLNLYDKLDAGTPLTHADLVAATRIGGPVARAAQLQGVAPVPEATLKSPGNSPKGAPKPVKTAKVSASAITAAKNELAQRLYSTVGIGPADLGKSGMNSKVPKSFSATMQNAGYAVTSNMTVKQALTSAQSVVGGTPAPTSVQSNQTVAQYIQSLQGMSKDQLQNLQKQLYTGGFYDQTYYSGSTTTGPTEYHQGVLDTGTMLAFRNAILQTLVAQKSGKNQTLDDTISAGVSADSASLSQDPGAGGSATGAKPPTTQPLATQAQAQAPLINAFVAALGRNPTQQELAAFTTSYQGQLTAGDKAMVASGGTMSPYVSPEGIPYVPGTPTVSAAATNYAQTQDPTEYQGHNIANAFGMLMNLVDRAGTSSLDTPGTRPTTTS